jgi:hypothetical protein
MMYHQTSTIKKRLMMKLFSSLSTLRQHSFKSYLIRAFVLIFCRIAFYNYSLIFAARSHDTLHRTFFFLSSKNRRLCTCRKISFHWIWRRDNYLRRLFWISDSKDIDEIISYQMFDECSRLFLFIFFVCIYFFKKWKRFAIKHFEMNNLISNEVFEQFLHENHWWVLAQCWRRCSIQYVRNDEITFWIKIFRQFDMLFNAFFFFN